MAIATVLSITGQAWARDEAGNVRELSVGDTLLEGEVLVTSDNGSVQLDFGDGLDPTLVEGGDQVVMAPELDADEPLDGSEFAALDEDLDALLTAIDEGEGDLLEMLEDPAAGPDAGGAGAEGGGHSFVRLARIVEEVNPLAFEYGLGQASDIDFREGTPAPEAPTEPEDVPEIVPEEVVPEIVPEVAVSFTLDSANNELLSSLTGTSTNAETITVVLTGGDLNETFTVTPNADGSWSVDISGIDFDDDVEYSVDVTATSIDGNTAKAEDSDSYLLPTVEITQFDVSSTDNIVSSELTGTTENATSVDVVVTGPNGEVFSGNVPVDTDGNWTVDLGTDLPEGEYTVVAIARDESNNTSAPDNAESGYTLPTAGDADGEGASITLTLADAETVDSSHEVSQTLFFTAGSEDIVSFAFGDPGAIHITGLDGDLTWALVDGKLIGSLNGDPVLKLSLTDTGSIAAQSSGSITVTAELLEALPHHIDTDDLTINGVSVVAADQKGNNAAGGVTVGVVDDTPVAEDDSRTIIGASATTITGNVIDGDELGQGADTVGADGATVTKVTFGGTEVEIAAEGATSIVGDYGKLTINADGEYRYETFGNAEDGVVDVFTYTLTDGDGDIAEATLTIDFSVDEPKLIVGTNADDDEESSSNHYISNPDPGAPSSGVIEGGSGDDILVGDIGGSTVTVEPGTSYNIALVVDVSGSMGEIVPGQSLTRMEMAKEALKHLAQTLTGHTGMINIGLISFAGYTSQDESQVTQVQISISDLKQGNIDSLLQAIDDLYALGGTNYQAAFDYTYDWFNSVNANPEYENLTFFLTDGDPTWYGQDDSGTGNSTDYATLNASVEAFERLSETSTVHAIGIGAGVNEDYLRFFDNTDVLDNAGSESFGGEGTVTGPVGEPQTVNTPEELAAALEKGTEELELANVGGDVLRGGEGDDIIFGDVIYTDDLEWDGRDWDEMPDGSGFKALVAYLEHQLGHEPTSEDIHDYIAAHYQELIDPNPEKGGNDTLIGGAGDDILIGGAGADTFAWEFGDQGTTDNPAEDRILDFSPGEFGVDPEADRLNLADLLQGENEDNIGDYIFAEEVDGDTVLHISSSGNLAGDINNADQVIRLEGKQFADFGADDGADLIAKMLDSGQLNIDQ